MLHTKCALSVLLLEKKFDLKEEIRLSLFPYLTILLKYDIIILRYTKVPAKLNSKMEQRIILKMENKNEDFFQSYVLDMLCPNSNNRVYYLFNCNRQKKIT